MINETYYITEKIHGCLSSETKISMADGTTKKIRDIIINKITDKVLGMDNFGNIVETEILNHFNNGKTEDWLNVYIESKGGDRGGSSFNTIRCTPNHKFFVKSKNKYIRADKLKPGDFVLRKRRDHELTFIQKEILKGKMLGDGSLVNRSVTFNHKKEHEEYINYTLDLLQNIAGNKQREQISGYGTKMCRARTISNYCIENLFKEWFYTGSKQVPKDIDLSPISLAFWFMDDGSLGHHTAQQDRACFATNGFEEYSIDNLLKALSKLGIAGVKYQSKGWRIRLNCDEADKLFTLISPYIPKCMQYKLPERYKNNNVFNLKKDALYKPTLIEQKILEVAKDFSKKGKTKWDIETGTHNFFANGILVHNSNISVYFQPHTPMLYGKRTSWLMHTEKFYDIHNTIKEYQDLWNIIQNIADKEGKTIRLFGEYFGGNIQKGVDYGREKRIMFFNGYVNDKLLTPSEFRNLNWGLPYVPLLDIVGDFKTAIEYNTELDSRVLGEANNEMEGVVIMPFDKIYRSPVGELFHIKKKNKKFKEVAGELKRRKQKLQKEGNPLVRKLNDEFRKYINENRLQSVFSKHGEIESIKDMGKYIRLLLEDAQIDFEKDKVDEIAELEPKDLKKVYNVGGSSAALLKKHL